ncbi:SHOCT domain-containing protein [Nocardioides jensenii]|uniref:SHOCT domain-containing protein n=1 Tax=Nocardioides jensenii TaxID=1843 RepID=UPI00083070E8|nr:SHOCT domain-containing protein [Nocardioides jensenii]
MLNALVMSADRWDGDAPAFWPIFPIFWFLMIVTFAYLVIRWGRRNRAQCGPMSGQSRLAERFAAGEIDEEEYRAKRAVLQEK